MYDEGPVRPGCGDDVAEAQEGGDNAVSVEKVRVLGGEVERENVMNVVWFQGNVFVESPARLKKGEIAVDWKGGEDNVEVIKGFGE